MFIGFDRNFKECRTVDLEGTSGASHPRIYREKSGLTRRMAQKYEIVSLKSSFPASGPIAEVLSKVE